MAKQRRPLADFTADREAGTEVSTPVLPPPPVTLGPEIPQNPPKLDAKPAAPVLTPLQVSGQDNGSKVQMPSGPTFKTESNRSRFERSVEILRQLYHVAEGTQLHGKIGVEVRFRAGIAELTCKVLEGTEK